MATRLLDVKMEFPWWFSLASAIWIFYTGDHLIDAFKLKNPQSIRRKFYSQNFSFLLYSVIILLIFNLFTSFLYLDKNIILFGISLGFLTSLYLSIVFIFGKKKKYWLQKELSVAVIYTVGIWGSIIIESERVPSFEISLIIISFFLLVLSDILIFALIEYHQDKQDQFISLIGMIGDKTVISLIYLLLAVSAVIVLFIIFKNPESKFIIAASIILLMTVMLFFIFLFRKQLLKNDRYRFWGEAVFYIPIIYLLLG